MKYRKLTAVLGTFMVIAAATGCQKASTDIELETLEIASVEVMGESGEESEQMETMELDLSSEEESVEETAEVSTGDLVEEEDTEMTEDDTEQTEEVQQATRKSGEAEEETEVIEEVKDNKKSDSSKKETEKIVMTEKMDETEAKTTVESKVEEKTHSVSETKTETEKIPETLPETSTEKTTEAETESEAVTEAATESEVLTEAETESEAMTETEVVTEAESEVLTEAETETESEVLTEAETETESEVLTEVETEIESEAVAESENLTAVRIVSVTDRVNVRREPSMDSNICALLVPGMKLTATGTVGEWTAVQFESWDGLAEGYIKTEFICDGTAIYRTIDNVNLRSEASMDASVVNTLHTGEKVVLADETEDGWSKVLYATEAKTIEGYVKTEFLEQVITDAEAEVATEAETETEAATEAEAETETEAATEAETETETEAATEAETETETEAVTEAETETETEAVTEAETETETTEDEADAVGDTGAVSESMVRIVSITDRVNVRASASTESEKLALLTPGMKLIAVGEEGEWTKIRFESTDGMQDGYIKSEFLCDADMIYTTLDDVNVRAEASMNASVIGALDAGRNVLVQDDAGEEWLKIYYSSDSKVIDAYVKAEYLKKMELNEGTEAFEAEIAKLLEAVQNETEAETEAKTEVMTEVETETETETEVMTEVETETETETEVMTEVETETETEAVTEVETETETEAVTEVETETETETSDSSVPVENETARLQYEFVKANLPEAAAIGLIYSAEDENAAKQAEEYESLAKQYELELITTVIEEELDIDLAASEMVGSVDCVFCLDDVLVNDLVQTICAYANEVEIPVIGLSEEQLDMGCIAVFLDGELIWNEEAAIKFGFDTEE